MQKTQKPSIWLMDLKLVRKYEQFLKFCIVGFANTMITLAIYYVLVKLDVHYLLASIIAYCAGLLNSYIFSSSFVFQQRRTVNQACKFVGVNASSLLINLIILHFLVESFELSKFLAQVFVTMFNVLYNFSLNKWWTFK